LPDRAERSEVVTEPVFPALGVTPIPRRALCIFRGNKFLQFAYFATFPQGKIWCRRDRKRTTARKDDKRTTARWSRAILAVVRLLSVATA